MEPITFCDKMGFATVNATVKLNNTQKKIMAILRVDKFATYDVISKQLGVERTTVWRNIKKLQDIGRLRREGGGKDGYWPDEGQVPGIYGSLIVSRLG